LEKKEGLISGEQAIRVQVIRKEGYKMKGEGWQGIGLPALRANVMVCGYSGRFVSF